MHIPALEFETIWCNVFEHFYLKMWARGSRVKFLNHVKDTCLDLYLTRCFYSFLFGWVVFLYFFFFFLLVVFFPHLVYADTNSCLAFLFSCTTPGLVSWESLTLSEIQEEECPCYCWGTSKHCREFVSGTYFDLWSCSELAGCFCWAVHPILSLPQPLPSKPKWNSELTEGQNTVPSPIRRISSLTTFLSGLVLVIQSCHCALNNDQLKSKGNLQVCVALSKSTENKRIQTEQNSFPISFQSIAKVARSLKCLSLEELALSEPDGVKTDWCECSSLSLPTASMPGYLSQTAPVKATYWFPFSQWQFPTLQLFIITLERAGFSEGSADGRSSCTVCKRQAQIQGPGRASPAAIRNLQILIGVMDNYSTEVL